MYGASESGLFGTDRFLPDVGQEGADLAVAFVFQAVFCSTAVTILSGAVAGRMKFSSYLWVVVLISGLIYPIYGHWVWNGGILAKEGFIDFAGSTVVHSIGGWVAFATLLILGARKGRFNEDGTVNDKPVSDIPLAMIGVIILWFGWFGFNGGSQLAWFTVTDQGTPEIGSAVPGIIANTLLGGAAGMVVALFLGWYVSKYPTPSAVANGTLAGLVVVTANCHSTDAASAVIIGGVGGAIAIAVEQLLLRFKIDDVVGAIPVHLAGGIWGTLAFGIFAQEQYLVADGGRSGQIMVKLMGIGAAAVWGFGFTYAALWLLNKVMPIRVSEEHEELGLNIEHGFAPTPATAPVTALPVGAMD